MPKIYLVNVGANSGHSGIARGPIFADGQFEYVSFPETAGRGSYLPAARPFVRLPMRTHLDPDWRNLTYGDCCQNRRARALLAVEPNDILLFWGLLWRIKNRRSSVWDSTDRGWYLLGALRVKSILSSRQRVDSLNATDRKRVEKNEHVHGTKVEARDFVRVFLGQERYSRKFARAVDLEIYKQGSLLVKTVRTSDGRELKWYERPKWNSATRSCRAILDLSDAEQKRRARRLRDAIQEKNPSCDLFADLV